MTNLRPIFDRLVIKPTVEDGELRESGLYLPPTVDDGAPPQHGIVLAAGPGLFDWQQAGIPMPVKVGDHVVFPYGAGRPCKVDGEELLVMCVHEVLGVQEDGDRQPVPTEEPERGVR